MCPQKKERMIDKALRKKNGKKTKKLKAINLQWLI
jgi:hypothetical protein